MEYVDKIANAVTLALALATAAGFVFRYYLSKFFEKVDRRQAKIEGMIKDGIDSLKDGFSELSRNQESSRKQMAREHQGLLDSFKEFSEHDREEHGKLIEQMIYINAKIESKKGGS